MLRAVAQKVKFGPRTQLRYLNVHEYRAAQLFQRYGISIPPGKVAHSGEEAEKVTKELGEEDVAVKAQVLTGGRGKGVLDSGLKGGVRLVNSPYEAKLYADQMIGHNIYTKQTGPHGKPISAVYIVQRVFYRREAYLSILYDRAMQQPVIVASARGGGDIEQVAINEPDAVKKFPVSLDTGVTDEQAQAISQFLGFTPKAIAEGANVVKNLWKLFDERDCTLAEINPLVETVNNRIMALDAKLNFDDNAEFRQEEVFSWRDLTQEDPDEVAARQYNLNFIKLDGNIGCLVNGAGLAMATMDIVKLNDGNPANFLDCGGGATAKSIEEAFSLILKGNNVSAVFVNIFGGIVRCDAIAKGLIATAQNMGIKIPIVARLQGTNYQEADKLIQNSGLKIFTFPDLDEAAKKVVQFSDIVRVAREAKVDVSFELPL
ncbi:succinate--CoA ligase (GDP-forming) subunit beta [Starmerella bacillaris]|uniref:Succinate--CoA ligase [ADP-forming] subunit beta, mitochondrial n=1 Tax=Starmerella bacillaris TaxID=1247836 RepID=A0AAV5RL01_STABA|nr:succinate--CoA ligase (GDP-forming) subunit beta [Starmerella bacillaris]